MVKIGLHFIAIVFLVVAYTACKKETAPTPAVPKELIETEPPIFKPVIKRVSDIIGGFYSALPVHYDETSKNYPLLVFIHGAGQYGNGSYDLPLLLTDAIPQLLDDRKFPPNFKVGDQHFSFIVLSPQFRGQPMIKDVIDFIEYARKNYRVDASRIYLTGLSVGGKIASDVASELSSQISAVVAMSGVSSSGIHDKCKKLAQSNIAVWAFHNKNDQLIPYTEPQNFISIINSFQPQATSRFTLFPASLAIWGHDSWTKATNPDYKENNRNIYEWMLQHKK